MNRLLPLFLTFILLGSPVVKAQQNETGKAEVVTQEAEAKQKFNRWSIAASFGAAVLDGDVPMTKTKIWSASDLQFAFNGQVACAISPIWSVFLEYDYTPMKGNMLLDKNRIDYNFKTLSHDVYLGANFNLLNLFNPNRRVNRWSLGFNLGFGVTMFNTVSTSNIQVSDKDGNILVNKGEKDERYCLKNEYAAIIPLGLNVEYAATKWLGVFLEAKYKMTQTDLYDVRQSGRSLDNVLYFGAGVRYKIGGQSKKRPFVGNITTNDYRPSAAYTLAEDNLAEIEALSREVAVMQKSVDRQEYPHPDIYAFDERVKSLEKVVDMLADELQSDKDNKTGYVGSVYYGLNEFTLDDYSEVIVLAVAKQLRQNQEMSLTIEAFGDNSGTEEVNNRLCERRANTIRNMMVEECGIAADRITIDIKGKVLDSDGKLKLNRRCDLIIIKNK